MGEQDRPADVVPADMVDGTHGVGAGSQAFVSGVEQGNNV